MRGAIAIGFLLSLSLLAWLTPAAGARKPQISYVDEHGTFQLYDAETGTNVSPAPPIPVPAEHNANQFTWAISPDGRYVTFTDAAGKLHLLDRSSNLPVPLPGIDKVPKPANLTVSDTGLIGYDNNSNKPTYVYDSIARRFFATGLDLQPESPTNEHRQPRLSGDGNVMVTTCFDNNESTCFTTGDGDSDVFVQNLVSRMAVPNFPDEAAGTGKDEEHPCINGDGTLIAVEKPNPMQKDIVLVSRSGSTFTAVPTPNLNDKEHDDRFCQLSPGGGYISDIQNNEYKLYERSSSGFVTLPSLPFDSRSTLTSPYSPPAGPPTSSSGGPTGSPQTGAPGTVLVTSFAMRSARFRLARQPTAIVANTRRRPPRGSAFLYSLTAPGTVRIIIERRAAGRLVGGRCVKPSRALTRRRRCQRLVAVGELTRRAIPDRNETRFSGRLGRRALAPGYYLAHVSATNSRSTSFTIVPG